MIRRLRHLLSLPEGELDREIGWGQDWGLAEWLAASRSFVSDMPAWKFWPKALWKWPWFDRQQRKDRKEREQAKARWRQDGLGNDR